MDWVIGMEDKTVWVARGENSEIIAIAASDKEAARAIVQTYYFDLNDEGMVEYDEEGETVGVIPLCGRPQKNVDWMLKLFW